MRKWQRELRFDGDDSSQLMAIVVMMVKVMVAMMPFVVKTYLSLTAGFCDKTPIYHPGDQPSGSCG